MGGWVGGGKPEKAKAKTSVCLPALPGLWHLNPFLPDSACNYHLDELASALGRPGKGSRLGQGPPEDSAAHQQYFCSDPGWELPAGWARALDRTATSHGSPGNAELGLKVSPNSSLGSRVTPGLWGGPRLPWGPERPRRDSGPKSKRVKGTRGRSGVQRCRGRTRVPAPPQGPTPEPSEAGLCACP